MCTCAAGKGHEKSRGLIRVSASGYVKVSIQFYNPYAAIPATAERQISIIGDMPPFFIFLEPKYIAPSTNVRIRGRISNELF